MTPPPARSHNATPARDRRRPTIELAETRFNTGSGSQVETLSAQTAMTDARDFYATALRNYSVAYSQLLRATGEDMSVAQPQRR